MIGCLSRNTAAWAFWCGVRWRAVSSSGKYNRGNPLPTDTRFAEAGQFVPFDVERSYQIVEVLQQVAQRHNASPARVAIAWTMAQRAISSVIIAARNLKHLEDNILAADFATDG